MFHLDTSRWKYSHKSQNKGLPTSIWVIHSLMTPRPPRRRQVGGNVKPQNFLTDEDIASPDQENVLNIMPNN